MDISWEKAFSQCLVLFSITNRYQDFYIMIAYKFLGAVGLVQTHIIERDCNLGSSVLCFRYISAWGIIFQERKFPHRSHVSRIPISTLLEI